MQRLPSQCFIDHTRMTKAPKLFFIIIIFFQFCRDRLTDEAEWDPRRLSRRHILKQHKTKLHQVTLCSQCCLPTAKSNMDTTATPQQVPPRRRNSTYLALACANAVSQGAMTRSLRQMFETQPIRETAPLLSRAEIKQAIQAARLRRNSVVVCPSASPEPPVATEPLVVTAVPAVVLDAAPTTPAKPTVHPFKLQSPATSPIGQKPAVVMTSPVAGQKPMMMSTPPTSPTTSIRCDKCSSILTTSPVSLVINTSAASESGEEAERSKSPSKIIPTNREVVEEELPKPDTVKNARCLFESSFMEAGNASGFSTLQHVKSNPSSKILRSESTMTLDRAGTRSSSVAGRPTFRWPTRHDHVRPNRSPSPSPSPSPVPAAVQAPKPHKMSATLPSYYRSSPSLTQYRSSRHSLHSTDVESYVSEGGSDCWSSSDLESEASYSSSIRDEDGCGLDGMRYISPDVMEKIRSYGMTLTFVNGKMVDEDDDEDEPEVIAKEAATRKVVQSIRSAGQSQPMTINNKKKSAVAPPPVVAPKKTKQQQHPPQQQQQPRIVACVPKPADKSTKVVKKIRHSSGESSASSGVSSGSNGDGSEHNSPFATLKRTKSADADHTVERSPSPGPRQSGTVKAVGSSPFGCYSVVYSFSASARSPMYV